MDRSLGPNNQVFGSGEDQMIRGADAIAEHIFGDRGSKRKIYYLAECSKIPIFRLGAMLCLRPAAYRRWVEAQEVASITPPEPEEE